jgi:hypothetical protein
MYLARDLGASTKQNDWQVRRKHLGTGSAVGSGGKNKTKSSGSEAPSIGRLMTGWC